MDGLILKIDNRIIDGWWVHWWWILEPKSTISVWKGTSWLDLSDLKWSFFVVFTCFQITQLSSAGKEKNSNWFSIHGALSSVLRAQPRTPTRCSGGFRDGCGLVWGWRHGGPTRSGVPSHSVWRVGNSSGYPPVNKHSYWKWPFIVDFPLNNGDFP